MLTISTSMRFSRHAPPGHQLLPLVQEQVSHLATCPVYWGPLITSARGLSALAFTAIVEGGKVKRQQVAFDR